MVAIMTGAVRSAKGVGDDRLDIVVTDWGRHMCLAFPEDCRGLEQIIEETESEKVYQRLGYETSEEFFSEELNIELLAPNYRKIFDWLKENKPDRPIPQAEVEANIEALGKPGTNRYTSDDSRESNGSSRKSSNRRAYTIARLKRDNPELAEKVINKEMSANAAAIEAGFRKRTICISEDPEKAAETIRRRFGDEFASKLKQLL